MSTILYITAPMREEGNIITWTVALPEEVTNVQIEQALQRGRIDRMAVTTKRGAAGVAEVREVHVKRLSDNTAIDVERVLKDLGATILA